MATEGTCLTDSLETKRTGNSSKNNFLVTLWSEISFISIALLKLWLIELWKEQKLVTEMTTTLKL